MHCRVCNSEEFRTIRLDNSSVEHFNPNRTYFSGAADLDFCVDCGTIRVDEPTRRQAANEPRRNERRQSERIEHPGIYRLLRS